VFENSLIHYLKPTHPLFITIYAVYFIIAINLAFVVRHGDNGRFRKIIVGSFTDLKNLSWVNTIHDAIPLFSMSLKALEALIMKTVFYHELLKHFARFLLHDVMCNLVHTVARCPFVLLPDHMQKY